MAKIKAFIFDLDGVITETSEYHYLAWQRLTDEEGLPFDRAANDGLRGVSRRDSLLKILAGRSVSEAQFEAMMKRKNDYYVDYLHKMSHSNRLPGVTGFLQQARSIGLKLGIGSASKNAWVVLEKIGLADYFDAVGDGSSVAHSKPAPDIFIWTAGALFTPIEQAVVFEDAEAGIDAAKRAGAYNVGIGTANVSHADIVLSGLDTLDPASIITRLEALR
jgi:beta-phosphoglucomutase